MAVARTTVRVVEPALLVAAADSSHIAIRNDSKEEVNLFGRALLAGGAAFFFPQDTILLPGQEVSFSSQTTRLKPENAAAVALLVVGETEPAKMKSKLEEERSKKIEEIKANLSLLQDKARALASATPLPTSPLPSETPSAPVDLAPQAPESPASSTLPAAAREGWLSVLKRFLIGGKN